MDSPLQALRKNAGVITGTGIGLVILGVLALLAPLLTGVTTALLAGVLILIAGLAQLALATQAKSWGAGLVTAIGGILALICGGVMIAHPLLGLDFLTLLLVGFFLVDGISRVVCAFQLRPTRGWGWLLFGGVVSLLLGVLIWRQWPLSGAWAIGTLLGIEMLFVGTWLISVASAAKRSVPLPA